MSLAACRAVEYIVPLTLLEDNYTNTASAWPGCLSTGIPSTFTVADKNELWQGVAGWMSNKTRPEIEKLFIP